MEKNNEKTLKDTILQFKNWRNYLKLKLKKIIIISILFGILGFTWASFQKPQYVAKLVFALEEEKQTGGGLGGALGIASQFGIELGGNSAGLFSNTSIMELMKTRSIIEKTLLKKILYNDKEITLADFYLKLYSKNNEKIHKLNYVDFPDRSKFTQYQDSLLETISSNIVANNFSMIQKDKKIDLYTIQVNSINQDFSKLFCENIAEVVSRFYIETKSKKAKNNLDLIQKQADSVRLELNNAISSVAQNADKVYNLNPAFNIKGIQSRRKQIDVQANTAILTQLVSNLEIAKVNVRRETPLIQIIDRPILPLKKEKTSRLISFVLFSFITFIFTTMYFIIGRIIKLNS